MTDKHQHDDWVDKNNKSSWPDPNEMRNDAAAEEELIVASSGVPVDQDGFVLIKDDLVNDKSAVSSRVSEQHSEYAVNVQDVEQGNEELVRSVPGAFREGGIHPTESFTTRDSVENEDSMTQDSSIPITATVVTDEAEHQTIREHVLRVLAEQEATAVGEVVTRRNGGWCGPRMWFFGITIVVLVAVAIVLVVLLVPRDPDDPPPPPEVLEELTRLLSSVSPDGGKALTTPSTPQNQALMWLAGNENLEHYPDEQKIQRYTLATLYYSTNGDAWKSRTGWLSDDQECLGWFHGTNAAYHPLNCTRKGAVTRLEMDANNLDGTVPQELALLSDSLEVLRLRRSESLVGPIPSTLYQLTRLEWLHLSENHLTGSIPAGIGDLTHLEFLLLFRNALVGTMPSGIMKLTDLVEMSLSNNLLEGSIPTRTGQLTNLVGLWLYNNTLSGPIPTTIGQLTHLRTLHLANNQFTGTIPAIVKEMTNLDALRLHDNPLSGNFTCPDFIETCLISCDDKDNAACRVL